MYVLVGIIIVTLELSFCRAYVYIAGEDIGYDGVEARLDGKLTDINSSIVKLPFPEIPPCHTIAYTRINLNYESGREFETIPRIYFVRKTEDLNDVDLKMDLYKPPTESIVYDIKVKASFTCDANNATTGNPISEPE